MDENTRQNNYQDYQFISDSMGCVTVKNSWPVTLAPLLATQESSKSWSQPSIVTLVMVTEVESGITRRGNQNSGKTLKHATPKVFVSQG